MPGTWTEEQKRAIGHRGGNLLVSAAAGSGKTAVLVEHIIRLVTDPVHPTDIDRLLVVTFTRAAAGEMKERLSKALTERLAEEPENAHLQEQSVLIHHAEITTIHGFCTYVIQNYYQTIGIDPGYRIAEEGELQLVRADVLSEMLEEQYAEGTEAFLSFMEAYAPGKTDAAAEELIQKVYDFSMSHPDPEGWLQGCVRNCEVSSDKDLSETAWMQTVLQDARLRLQSAADRAKKNTEKARINGLDAWVEVLADDQAQIEALLLPETYAGMAETLANTTFKKWPSVTAKVKKNYTEAQVELLDDLKKGRPRDLVKKIRSDGFSESENEILQDLQEMKPAMQELVRLVLLFAQKYKEKKQEKNIADFSDLEHMALQILITRNDDGTFSRTDAARELSGRFDEVIVDEYQDSNYLQETILEAVSGEEEGHPDRFMVGDMKQSIYGFRMARPKLFLDKFNAYRVLSSGTPDTDASGMEKSSGQVVGDPRDEKSGDQKKAAAEPEGERVDLSKNFRSRREVLDAVNAFFEKLMIPELGGIRYDEAQALHFGAAYYPENPDRSFPKAELLLACRENPDFSAFQTGQGKMELEASAVAARIKEMVGREQVYDRDRGAFRPLRYRDCVVLLRATTGWSDVFVKTLQENGIPAYAVSKVGYFSAQEVMTVLDYLSIIDNPKQDIAMTAILRSPIVGCTDRELAEIRIAFPELPFFDAVRQYADEYKKASVDDAQAESSAGKEDKTKADGQRVLDENLGRKLTDFLAQLENFRKRVPCTPVHMLIEQVLEETGYGAYAAAMPAGEQRAANLRMLVEKAISYEKTSYHGLFNFIRYIERLKKYQIDYGEVNVSGESEDIVRVMSIHMSKGLEFPVVFVSGTSRNFNQMDERRPIVMHADLGIGMRLIDLKARTKKDTILRTAIRKKMEQEDKGEELRVLYVAMTRAEEKLILTGLADKQEEIEGVVRARDAQEMMRRHVKEGGIFHRIPLDYEQLMKGKSYLSWMEEAVPDAEILDFREIQAEDIALPEAEEKIRVRAWTDRLRRDGEIPDVRMLPEAASWTAEEKRAAGQMADFLKKRDDFVYPYKAAADLPAKLSVTEIKDLYEDSEEETDVRGKELFEEELQDPYIPEFMRTPSEGEDKVKKRSLSPAARGTIYHHFLQCLRYEDLPQDGEGLVEAVRAQIEDMKQRGILSEEEAACLRPGDFETFLRSDIGRRMQRAAGRGQLHREQPFVIDIRAKDIDTTFPEDENILVQGIIDAYFQEDGKWVLVDYKTDRVRDRNGQALISKYAPQLRYYKEALNRITGMETAEMWLYSFSLGRALPVDGV